MCTHEDTLAHILGTPYIDDVMSYNSLTTHLMKKNLDCLLWILGSEGYNYNPFENPTIWNLTIKKFGVQVFLSEEDVIVLAHGSI